MTARINTGGGVLCMECHRGTGALTEHGGVNHMEYCADCHAAHAISADLYLIHAGFSHWPAQTTNPVAFDDDTATVGRGGFVDPDLNVEGVREACSPSTRLAEAKTIPRRVRPLTRHSSEWTRMVSGGLVAAGLLHVRGRFLKIPWRGRIDRPGGIDRNRRAL